MFFFSLTFSDLIVCQEQSSFILEREMVSLGTVPGQHGRNYSAPNTTQVPEETNPKDSIDLHFYQNSYGAFFADKNKLQFKID